MASPSFLKPAGLHRIRFQEDLIESDVHTTPGEQGAHVTFNYTGGRCRGSRQEDQNCVLWKDREPRDRMFQITVHNLDFSECPAILTHT